MTQPWNQPPWLLVLRRDSEFHHRAWRRAMWAAAVAMLLLVIEAVTFLTGHGSALIICLFALGVWMPLFINSVINWRHRRDGCPMAEAKVRRNTYRGE